MDVDVMYSTYLLTLIYTPEVPIMLHYKYFKDKD